MGLFSAAQKIIAGCGQPTEYPDLPFPVAREVEIKVSILEVNWATSAVA
jgi:hypothetical protein